MTPSVQLIGVPGAETESATFIAWLIDSYFRQPASWNALSVRLRSDGPGRGYGAGGYFYGADGAWEAAAFQEADDSDEPFDAWITATAKAFGRPWIKCLMHIVRGPTLVKVRFQFEFRDWERWEYQGDRELGDMLRPPGLPIPPPRKL